MPGAAPLLRSYFSGFLSCFIEAGNYLQSFLPSKLLSVRGVDARLFAGGDSRRVLSVSSIGSMVHQWRLIICKTAKEKLLHPVPASIKAPTWGVS
jgi:hypothetical protein